MFKKSYHRNIGLLGATEFFAFLGITSFWLLFLSQHGMSLWQIGLLESIFHGTSLLSEVPSGVLADRFSYKSNLYLSRLMSILSCLLMLWGNGHFWIYALGMMVNAWAYNFDSGTSSAMLFESAKEAGLEHRYLKFSSLMSGIAEATRTLGMVVAGFFVHGFLDCTYRIQIVLSLFVMVFIFFMKEPLLKEKREQSPSISRIVSTVIREFKRNPRLLWWLMTTQFIGVIMCMFYFYYQNEMEVLSSWQISLVMLVSSGINIGAVWLASRIGHRLSALQLFPILVGITGLFYGLSFLGLPLIYVLIYLVTDGLYALFLPIFNNDLQHVIASDVRATMLSVNAMFFSLSMMGIFPLTGWLIDQFGFLSTFVGLGILLVLLAILLAMTRSYFGQETKRNHA